MARTFTIKHDTSKVNETLADYGLMKDRDKLIEKANKQLKKGEKEGEIKMVFVWYNITIEFKAEIDYENMIVKVEYKPK